MIKIWIIHKSEIIALGLERILRENLDSPLEIIQFDTPESQTVSAFPDLIFAECTAANYSYLTDSGVLAKSFGIYNAACQFPFPISFKSDTPVQKLLNQIKKSIELPSDTEFFDDQMLSKRETEILTNVAMGFSNKEIADKLFISIHTVITHRKNITNKLGIKSISGLTVYAILNNLIDTNSLQIEDLV